MMPPEIVDRLTRAMLPGKVCRTCGQPSRRIVQVAGYVTNRGKPAIMDMDRKRFKRHDELNRAFIVRGAGDASANRIANTVGWTDCGHDDWRPGVVLDPFADSPRLT